MNIALQPWHAFDANNFIEMINHVDFSYEDDEMHITDYSDARYMLERWIWNEDYNGDFYRAIWLGGELVGHVQVARQSGVWSRDGHVGCMLVKEATGHGIGTEAVRQMVEMAFTRRNYNRLTAVVYSPNKASAHMVEKLGFTHEATLHRAVHKGECYYDALIYGLLREETGIDTSHCCEPEDELSPEEQTALEPALVSPRDEEEWCPLDLSRFEKKDTTRRGRGIGHRPRQKMSE